MIDIQTVSIAIASASVVAGVIYYAFQIRHQAKMRQTDFIVRPYSTYDRSISASRVSFFTSDEQFSVSMTAFHFSRTLQATKPPH